MASEDVQLAIVKERVDFLLSREGSHHTRIHEVEDLAGKTETSVQILKEKASAHAATLKKHDEVIFGNGEIGLAEMMRNAIKDIAWIKSILEAQVKDREALVEKKSDRIYGVYMILAAQTVGFLFLIFREAVFAMFK